MLKKKEKIMFMLLKMGDTGEKKNPYQRNSIV